MISVIEPFVRIVQGAFEQFCVEGTSPNAYRDFLYQTYIYVNETVPVIRAVAAACPDHPLAGELAARSEDELGHDEMLLADLRLLGPLPSGEISPALERLVQLERSTPFDSDPVSALLGHIVVMEGFPPTVEDIHQLVSRFGVSITVASAFLFHAEADISHAESVKALISHTSIDRAILLNRAITTCRLLSEHWLWMKQRHVHIQ